MGSNLGVLKDLLLTCPQCSWREIFEICKIDNHKQLSAALITLYKNEISDAVEQFDCQDPNINLEDDQYYNELLNWLNKVNDIIESKHLFFRNYELIDTICSHLEELIALNIESRGYDQPKETFEKSREKLVASLKKNQSTDNIVNTLVFEIKDIKFFKLVFEEFFTEFNQYFKNEANVSGLFEKYIDLTKDETVEKYDFISISKIISYIINNRAIGFSANKRKANLNILNRTVSKLSNSKYSKQERKKIISSLNILIDYVKDTRATTKQEFIEKINNKYKVTPHFSTQVLQEADNLKKINNKLYTDLTNKQVMTFDCSKNVCHEDAFSIEVLPNGNYLLGIYITDVYSYINDKSILEFEAYKRAKTIYLPEKPLPIFPENLVYNQFSLKSKQKKYVMANLFELSPTCDIVDYSIKRAIITVDKNMTFKELEKQLKKGKDPKINDFCSKLVDLNDSIKKTNPVLSKYYNKSSGNSNISCSDIIENFMIYLNYNSGDAYGKLELPCIYKIYFMNKCIKNINNMKLNNKPLVDVVIDNLQEPPYKSFYSTKKSGHSGSNLCVSMSTTVPVRNYAALQNQKLIQKYYIDKEKIKDSEIYNLEEQLAIVSNHLNEKNKLLNEYSEEYRYGIKRYKRRS